MKEITRSVFWTPTCRLRWVWQKRQVSETTEIIEKVLQQMHQGDQGSKGGKKLKQ